MKYLKPIATGTLIALLVLDLLLRLERPAAGQREVQFVDFSVIWDGSNAMAYALASNNRIYESRISSRLGKYLLQSMMPSQHGGKNIPPNITDKLERMGISPYTSCGLWMLVQTETEAQVTDAKIIQQQR